MLYCKSTDKRNSKQGRFESWLSWLIPLIFLLQLQNAKIFLLFSLMHVFGILSFSGSWWTVLWKHIILQNGGTITNLLNISCLAKVSDGFTQGHIIQAVQAVLSELRLLQMTRKPLRTAEFMTSLARQDPVYKEEEETFKVTLRAMLTGCLSSSPAMSLSRHICSGDLLILLMSWHITVWMMMYGSTAPNTHLPHLGMFGSPGHWVAGYARQTVIITGSNSAQATRLAYCFAEPTARTQLMLNRVTFTGMDQLCRCH